jgi:hypothetical protein
MRHSLRDLLPAPRPLRLAGVEWLASELTISDLAELDRAILRLHQIAQGIDPAAPPPGARPEPGESVAAYHARLRRASRAAEPGVPAFGEPAGDAILFNTIGGLASIAYRSLIPAHPDLTFADAHDLAGTLGPGELAGLETIAFALDPAESIARLIDREAGVDLPAPEAVQVCWADILASLLLRRWPTTDGPMPLGPTGLTFEAIGRLTLTQFRVLRAGGQPEGSSAVHPDLPAGWSDAEFERRVLGPRERFWGAEGQADG